MTGTEGRKALPTPEVSDEYIANRGLNHKQWVIRALCAEVAAYRAAARERKGTDEVHMD